MGTLKLNRKIKLSNEAHDNERATAVLQSNATNNIVTENTLLHRLAHNDDGLVKELTDKRNTNCLVYERNNRTCRKIVSATPMLYRSANNELKEINNTLSDTGSEIVNTDNSYSIKFHKSQSSDKIFELSNEDKTLTLRSMRKDGSRTRACGCRCEKSISKDNAVIATLDDGTQIEYAALNDRIKENIIISEKQDSYEYLFSLDIGDMTVEESDHNSLLLKDSLTGAIKFVIPAPFMYDANKAYSNDVSYEIDSSDGQLQFKVIASASFINAENRVFPVTIDPQIIIYRENNNIWFETRIQWLDDDENITYDRSILEVRDYNEICDAYVYYNAPTAIEEGAITNVKLVLTVNSGSGSIKIDGNTVAVSDEQDLEFDVHGSGQIRLEPTYRDSYAYAEFGTSGSSGPRFIIDYVPFANEDQTPELKKFDFTDKATGYFYAKSGELATSFTSFDSADFVAPLNIVHVHKLGFGKTAYGLNWRLNLDKKLSIAQNDTNENTKYVYTDEFGDQYLITEKYYYLDGDEKVFIEDKSSIDIDLNENLTYNGHSVYTYQSVNGLTMIVKKDDFSNVELLDQKQSEQAELESYLNTYSVTLSDYVKVNKNTGAIVSRMSALTKANYTALISGVTSSSTNIIISESEALQLQSLYSSLEQYDTQRAQLNAQKNQLNLQKSSYDIQLDQLSLQLLQTDQQIDDYKDTRDYYNAIEDNDEKTLEGLEKSNRDSAVVNIELLEDSTDNGFCQKSLLAAQKELIESSDPSKLDQMKSITEQLGLVTSQLASLSEQEDFINAQINYIISRARDNLSVVKDNFIEYFKKQAQYDLLVRQIPVNYLKDSSGNYCGFNEAGDLVYISDANGNACMISWDTSHNVDYIYNESEILASFTYDDGHLKSITDNRGRVVNFSYETNTFQVTKLVGVTFADGEKLDLMYSDNRMHNLRLDSRNSQVKIYQDANGVYSSIVYLAKPGTISKNTTFTSTGYKTEKTITISKTATGMSFTDDEDNCESYVFNDAGALIKHTIKDNTNSENVTNYTYVYADSGKTITETTTSNKDNKTSTVIKQYNNIGQLISVTEDWQPVSDTVSVKNVTAYDYDLNGNVVTETATKSIDTDGTIDNIVSVTEYNYNNAGQLILTKQYIDDENALKQYGISYEERVYNENGFCTKTISWNSLDSSSKFYSESDVAESGQVMADRDETGNVSAEYEYINKTNVVNSVKYANGSKLAYGRNPYNYNITSVTQNTDEGEENTSDRVYAYGLPVTVKSGNTVIDYCYDQKGRKTKVDINGVTQATYSYQDYTPGEEQFIERVVQTTLPDNTVLKKEIRGDLDEDTGIYKMWHTYKVNNAEIYREIYNSAGLIYDVRDAISGTTLYTYDEYNNLTQAKQTNNSSTVLTENYTYNANAELTQKAITGEVSQTYTYSYKDTAARELDYVGYDTYKFYPLTDVNGRNTGREIVNGTSKLAAEYITYRKVGDHATNMPATVWFGNGNTIKDSIKYKYDSCGNICEITQNGHLFARYNYDSLNRLIREDNKGLNKTLIYTYDANGNIVERCEYAYTNKATDELSDLECTHYSYDYDGDKLVSYNGTTIAYNDFGNPTTYRGNAITWQYGKRLTGYGNTTFTYDGQGRRISKNDITFTYDSNGNLLKQSNGLEFIYDNSGVIGVKYNNVQYFYRRDAQGNIIAILDSTGNVVVEYKYGAWGNHEVIDTNGNKITVATHIGNLNPFRYRGYYYDTETGLYYLQTRYYDPEVGRFISRDSIEYADPETINGLNLYAYCGNNPVMGYDPTGHFWFTFLTTIIGAVVGAFVGIVDYVVNNNGEFNFGDMMKMAVAGAASGATSGFILGITKGTGIMKASYLSAAVYSGVQEIWNYASGSTELTLQNISLSFVKVVGDTVINGSLNYLANYGASRMVTTNSGWFIPKTFTGYFGKYGKRIIAQTIIGGAISNITNIFWRILKDIDKKLR